jgi:protein-disulfide isomerase
VPVLPARNSYTRSDQQALSERCADRLPQLPAAKSQAGPGRGRSDYAEQVGLDKDAFGSCFEERRFSAQVARDIEEGKAAGVTGTPAFFINGVMLSGARPEQAFFELIDAELARN